MGISREQALDCFASDDLIGIGMEADAVRRRLHPEGVVSYSIDRILNLNALGDDLTALHTQVADAIARGATGISVRGAIGRSLASIETLFRDLKTRYPQLRLHALSAAEVLALAGAANLPLNETFSRLRAAGLDSMPGDGAQALGTELWLQIHRAAHQAGIPTTAVLRFGAGESMEDRVTFLEAIHTLQQETRGFTAFLLTSYENPTGRDLDDATAVEYLKTLAISRMLLDNIDHVQANWEQQGLKVLQMGLRFGGNDVGSLLGTTQTASEEELRRLIRDAGFRPAQRDTLYRTLFLN